MYEQIVAIGKKGQITIPKIIRDEKGIKEKDKLIVKLENNNIIVKKIQKTDKTLLKEGYENLKDINKKLVKEFDNLDLESDKFIGDY